MKIYPYYLANKAMLANTDLEVRDKFTGAVAAQTALADTDVIDQAIVAAAKAAPLMAAMPPYERQQVLLHAVKRFSERAEELALNCTIESGKPIKDSRGEVQRLIETFRVAAEESVRQHGEAMNLEINSRSKGYRGFWKRVPIGPCSFITPFNFPLNLVAHKIAPAIAAGCPFILKPSQLTPMSALCIGEILAETNLPPGAFSILPCRVEDAGALTTDDRIKLLSFTGSPSVGWKLKREAGKKKVALELGGNAACVVEPDADLDDVTQRLIFGAFYQSGQSCISVQRIYIHTDIYDALKQRLIDAARALATGDPKLPDTFVGPMISERTAIRLEAWIHDAVLAGGKVLCGGNRSGAVLEATLMEDVPKEQAVVAKEAFGPLAVLARYTDYNAVLDEVNDSVYGLQAGIFTRDVYHMLKAWDRLEVGGVIIGDVPAWRVEHMPYGGVKESGLGREGIRFALEEMTEIRNLVIRTP